MEALVRSVGRDGHRTWWQRLLHVQPRHRDLDASFDFRDRGENVWQALRF
jgi:hypothetical protein